MKRLDKYPNLQTLFAIDTDPVREPMPDPEPELREARAVWVRTRRPAADGGHVVLLRVECPYCEHVHIHAAGTTRSALLGVRQPRCVKRPTGSLRYTLRLDDSAEGSAA